MADSIHGGPSEVTAGQKLTKKRVVALGGAALLSAGAIYYIGSYPSKKPETKTTQESLNPDTVGAQGRPFTPVSLAPPAVPTATPSLPSLPGSGTTPAQTHTAPWTRPALASSVPAPKPPSPPISLFHATGMSIHPASPAGPEQAGGASGSMSEMGGNGLAARLGPSAEQDTAVATMLADRNLMITMGTPIACITEQPLNTDLPGLFRCKLPEPVFGASGKVQLLDRGTWMVGELRDPLKRGQRRGFAVMTRIETPQSCIVKLRAPIGDQIGAAGIDMDIDTHFFERFKSYAAIALIDMISQGGAQALGNLASNGNKNSGNGGVGLSFNSIQSGGQQLGQSAFGDDINIPSTGTTPQARRITVLPMSDIDMRGCYQLRTAGGTR